MSEIVNKDSPAKNAEKVTAEVKTPEVPMTPIKRKLKKLKRDPLQFFKDSQAFLKTQKGLDYTWAKMGSFAFVVLASMILIGYFGIIASPRYVSEAQFVVKQSGSSDLPIAGLASLGAVTGTMRDALIIKEFIESRDMAVSLDESIGLKGHYQQAGADWFSRLSASATVEDYVDYYKKHLHVHHDEMSDIVYVEVQAFDPEFALLLANKVLELSEKFINSIGNKMATEQLRYAQGEVERSHDILKQQQARLLAFQDDNKLYSPEQEGGALVQAINGLQAEIIKADARLKELRAVMRDDAPEVRSQRNLIDSLTKQLAEEKSRLTSSTGDQSLNKVNTIYQEIKLSVELASDLYKSSLASLESVRADAYRKLKHLLIVQYPALAEEDKYPRRAYNILTWFVTLLLMYLVGRLVFAIVKEHKD
ncbi:MAG: lipopolysaccharide biosynthesis protein [Saccharospirillaceae bacterium]|nr:lipopolysaccharide biosynthesis protein [Saccharospirillaceae bacterium]MCD8530221.1 lipopolysaccharide biosynthesis protein [Saccharospirillaceae bacterium]